MDQVLFGTTTVKEVLLIGGGVIAGIFLLILIGKIFGGKKKEEHFQNVSCSKCGWQGQVSKFAGRCPKCNQPLGSRKSAPPKS